MIAAARQRAVVLAQVWRNRDLRRAELAWGGFHAAEWAALVAISVVAFRAHGTAAVGFVLFARMAACALVSPYVAVLGDRLRRERILLAVHASRAAAFGAAAVALASGGDVLVVYVLAVVAALPLAAHRPAHLGLVPLLGQTPAQLTAANVVSMLLESAAALAGPALAAVLLALSEPAAVLGASAGASLLSALLVARVSSEWRPAAAPGRRLARELREGAAAIAANPRLRVVVGLFGAQTLVRGFLGVFLVVVALDLTSLGEPGVGLLSAAFGFGGLAGALAALMLVGRAGAARPFQLSLAFWGLPLLVIGVWPAAGVAVVALALAGLANTTLDVAGFTSMQEHTDERLLGRVFGLFELLVAATVGAGSLLAPVAVDVLGGRTALVAVGALLPALALLLHRQLGRLDEGSEQRAADAALLRANPIFAALPYATVRGLVGAAERATAVPGEAVVREGDVGRSLYVIAAGAAEVVRGGRVLAALRKGDAFGEVALLLDVPRTATVRASSRLELLVLGREQFLAAVTGHRVSEAALRALVDARREAAVAPPAAGVAAAS